MNIRFWPYLRASTDDQDASRAKSSLEAFAHEHGFKLSTFFIENVSGAKLHKPELFRLLDIAMPGDCLVIEQVDRLSRLTSDDWEKLKTIIKAKEIRIVSMDLPSSLIFLRSDTDQFTSRILLAFNGLMLDVLAAVARKDFEDRRRRQAEGIEKAKSEQKYKGRPVDQAKHENISKLLDANMSWNEIQKLLGVSRATISKVAKSKKAHSEPR